MKYFNIFNILNDKNRWLIARKSELKINSLICKTQLKKTYNNLYKLTLKSQEQILSGWYIIVFKYTSNDVNLSINIKNGKSNFFSQKKIISPERKKFRITHFKNKSNIFISIEGISESIRIRHLVLLKIPQILVHIFLIKVLKNNYLIFSNQFLNLPILWKNYNLRESGKLFGKKSNFNIWLQFIEPRVLNQKKYRLNSNYSFVIQHHQNISKVKNNEYVLCFNKEFTELYQWTIDIVSFSINKKDSLLIYGDEDRKNLNNQRTKPFFKTGWNKELFLNDPNYSSLWIVSGKIWNQSISELELELFDFKKNYKIIIFKVIEILERNKYINKISHIPFILSAKNSEFNASRNRTEFNLHRKALKRYVLEKYNPKKVFILKKDIGFNIQWPVPKEDKLSIVIPTRDNIGLLKKCLTSISEYSSLSNYEIIIVNNNSIERETHEYFSQFLKDSTNSKKHKIIQFNEEFNYSKMNNISVKETTGSVILFLNNDVEFLQRGWDSELLTNSLRKDIGFVGIKLLYPNHTIQHAGVTLGGENLAIHPFKRIPEKNLIYNKQVQLSQEFSALTGACMSISKEKWILLKGMDQSKLKVCFNDVDICLRAKSFGLRNIYLSTVKAIHHESKSRGRPTGGKYKQFLIEKKTLKKRWASFINNDPYYIPNNDLLKNNNYKFFEKKIIR